MKVTRFLPVFLIFIFSCTGEHQSEQIRDIRRLEFQRNTQSGIFDKFLTDNNLEIKILIADAIAKIGNSVHRPVLITLLREDHPPLTIKSIFALGQIGEQDSLLFSLLDNPHYQDFGKNILDALGRSKSELTLLKLLDKLPSITDSLKTTAIKNIAFIAPVNYKNRDVKKKIEPFLLSPQQTERAAAAYFFSRQPYTPALRALIRMPLSPGSTGDKYRLKAISRALENYSIQAADSTMIDTLAERVSADLANASLDWRHKIYDLSILKVFENEIAYRPAISYLKDKNPHLRKAAIETIAFSDSLEAKQVLLKAYTEASWNDKGMIIYALSKKYPDMTYALIQQNLDKGNLYFKQLLLRSLAVIKNRMAVNQLIQFLQVPTPRLKYTAFEELSKLRAISYAQSRLLLLSGDPALSSLAANWIVEHPETALLEDLSTAYQLHTEPAGVEAMLAILEALALLRDNRTNAFLSDAYQKTNSFAIARRIEIILKDRDFPIHERTVQKTDLFIPEPFNFSQASVDIQIKTDKGDLVLTLLPKVAPATVNNFLYLINKGFYNNLSFHRVVSDFVVQGGDPRGDGWGGPGYSIPCEYNEHPFLRGTLGLATAGKDTGGCQFFICHSEQPHLDRRYTVFGQVISGMEIVDIIEIDDKIKQISILK